MDKMELLSKWHEAQESLRQAKEAEADLRKQVVEEFFANVPEDAEGTFSLPLGGGFKLKSQYKLARKINTEALDEMRERIEETGVKLDEVIHWTPVLRMAAYNTLTLDQRQVFDEVVESKQSFPALKIDAPKPQEG